MIVLDEYDIGVAFKAIEDELIKSMIRNMDRHRAEETKEGIEWSMWQAEQLKALEKYKRENQKRYSKQFKSINGQIGELLYQARQTGNMQQEIQILKAIQRGCRFPNMPKKLFGLLEEMDGKTFQQKASLLLKRLKGKEAAQATAEFFKLNDRKLEALSKQRLKTWNAQRQQYCGWLTTSTGRPFLMPRCMPTVAPVLTRKRWTWLPGTCYPVA